MYGVDQLKFTHADSVGIRVSLLPFLMLTAFEKRGAGTPEVLNRGNRNEICIFITVALKMWVAHKCKVLSVVTRKNWVHAFDT